MLQEPKTAAKLKSSKSDLSPIALPKKNTNRLDYSDSEAERDKNSSKVN
jgi:hypothetical protein